MEITLEDGKDIIIMTDQGQAGVYYYIKRDGNRLDCARVGEPIEATIKTPPEPEGECEPDCMKCRKDGQCSVSLKSPRCYHIFRFNKHD